MPVHSIAPYSAPLSGGTVGVQSSQPAAVNKIPFANLMTQFLQEIDQQQQQVSQGANLLAAGEIENIHELAVTVAQADIAFRLVMEVRDKLISAYQEVMRMQV